MKAADPSVLLTPLNHDSSWEFRVADGDGAHILWVDPWLQGDQVDIAPWFSKQRHALAALSLADANVPTTLIVSHPFTDHCHQETLQGLAKATNVLAVPAAERKISRWQHFEKVVTLEAKRWIGVPAVTGCEVAYFPSSGFLDFVHNAFVFRLPSGALLVYAPHGCSPALARKIRDEMGKPLDVLLTTHTYYVLPFYLGGPVNLGVARMAECAKILEAHTVIGTHDEAKHASGIVSKLANVTYTQHPQRALAALGFTGTYVRPELGTAVSIQKRP